MSLPLRIELFGGLRVGPAGQPLADMSRQQTGSLLAFLALHLQRAHNRDELVALLWPDDSGDDGRRKLRQSIYSLKKQLENGHAPAGSILVTRRDTVQLNPGAIETDVAEFERAIESSASSRAPADRLQHLDRARDLYSGELLAGFYLDDFLSHRSRLAAMHRSALQERIRVNERLSDLEGAIDAARELVALDPLIEEAHADLMRLYARAGRPSEIWRQYRELEEVLETELGVEPAESTRLLAERLRAETELNIPQSPAVAARPTPLSEEAPSCQPAPRRLRWAVAGLGAILISATIWMTPRLRSAPTNVKAKAPANKPSEYGDAKVLMDFVIRPKTGDRDSEPVAIETDKHGYVWVGGFVQTADNDVDMLIEKYDEHENRMWTARHNGAGDDVDRLKDMAVGSNGHVFVIGETYGKSGNGDGSLSELDVFVGKIHCETGQWLWKRAVNGEGNGRDSAIALCLDEEQNAYVAARVWEAKPGCGALAVFKYDPNGRLLWEFRRKRQVGENQQPVDIVLHPTGVLFSAQSAAPGKPGQNLLVKLNARTGREEWTKELGSPVTPEMAPRVAVDPSGAIYFAVETSVEKYKDKPISKVRIARYDADGNRYWDKTLSPRRAGIPTDMQADPRGGVVIGTLVRYPPGAFMMIQVDPNGEIRESKRLSIDPGHSPPGTRISVDSSGNVALVTSRFQDIVGPKGTAYDGVICYYSLNKRNWKHFYDGPDHSTDTARAIVNRDGNIYAALQSETGGVRRIRIIRFSHGPNLPF